MPLIQYVAKRFRQESLLRIKQANDIIAEYQAQGFDLTLRQLYYQFVSRDLIPNNQKSYDNLGCLISDARLAGLVDWDAIQDRTRNLRSNSHWESPESIVSACAKQYRIDRWAKQDFRLEVWIEKDALVGVIEGVCQHWDVPYFSCRGYTSQSEMWIAGQRLAGHINSGQTPIVLHLGDHDPSGIDMTRDIRERLTMFAEDWVEVKRIALNMDQIREFQPPPNPAKLTDSRAGDYIERYGYESWELDALDPTTIEKLIAEHIRHYLDAEEWQKAERREASERSELASVAGSWDSIIDNLGPPE